MTINLIVLKRVAKSILRRARVIGGSVKPWFSLFVCGEIGVAYRVMVVMVHCVVAGMALM